MEIKKRIAWNKGKVGAYSEESLARFRNAKRPKWSEAHRMNMIEAKKDKKATRWIEDRTKLKIGHIRAYDTQYKYWMLEVKNRDGWKCKMSNKDCLGRLEAHHILGWTKYPELRYKTDNGITLCKFHHPLKRTEEQRLAAYFQGLIR